MDASARGRLLNKVADLIERDRLLLAVSIITRLYFVTAAQSEMALLGSIGWVIKAILSVIKTYCLKYDNLCK